MIGDCELVGDAAACALCLGDAASRRVGGLPRANQRRFEPERAEAYDEAFPTRSGLEALAPADTKRWPFAHRHSDPRPFRPYGHRLRRGQGPHTRRRGEQGHLAPPRQLHPAGPDNRIDAASLYPAVATWPSGCSAPPFSPTPSPSPYVDLRRAIGSKGPERGAHAFGAVFSNCAFMGFPVVEAILGKDAIFAASIANIPFQFSPSPWALYSREAAGGKAGSAPRPSSRPPRSRRSSALASSSAISSSPRPLVGAGTF